MSPEVLIAIVVFALLAFAFVKTRNRMVDARNRADEAWSGVDVQLKRRHDLVPNLVETVKGYARHERDVFDRTATARADAMKALGAGPAEESATESQLSRALTGLRAVAEDYPDLRATENFQSLQRQLAEIEDEIQASRRIYNSNAQSYNTRVQMFPNLIVAAMSGLSARHYFEIDEPAEREPAEVSFS